jgi:hypothetical protein
VALDARLDEGISLSIIKQEQGVLAMAKASQEKLFKSWTNVPGNSKLLISVSGTTATKMVLAHLDGIVTLPNDKVSSKIEAILDTVNGTPEVIKLVSPRIYTIDVINTFITDAEATVHAHIMDPAGAQFGTAFDTVLRRTKGQVEMVTIIVGTQP